MMDQKLVDQCIAYHGPSLVDCLAQEQVGVRLPSFLSLSHGTNQEQPRDERFNERLVSFIAKKADALFKENGGTKPPKVIWADEEAPYSVVPPIEAFMEVAHNVQRASLFKILAVGDLVTGIVASIQETGLTVNLLSLDEGRIRDIDQLKLLVHVPLREIPRFTTHKNAVEAFAIKDKIRGVVISVSASEERVVLSLQESALPPGKEAKVGIINREDFPLHYRKLTELDTQSFEYLLHDSNNFSNSESVNTLLEVVGLDDQVPHSLTKGLRLASFDPSEFAPSLRKTQSYRRALKSVAEGVRFFKEGKAVEAMQHLNKALQIDPENVEALVARGALYANNESYPRALEDFEAALKENPKHSNARTYMCETLLAQARSLMDMDSEEDAIPYLEKALVLNPDLPQAKRALERIREEMDQQKRASRMRQDSLDRDVTPDSEPEKNRGRSSLEGTSETLRKLIEEDKQKGRRRRSNSLSHEKHRNPSKEEGIRERETSEGTVLHDSRRRRRREISPANIKSIAKDLSDSEQKLMQRPRNKSRSPRKRRRPSSSSSSSSSSSDSRERNSKRAVPGSSGKRSKSPKRSRKRERSRGRRRGHSSSSSSSSSTSSSSSSPRRSRDVKTASRRAPSPKSKTKRSKSPLHHERNISPPKSQSKLASSDMKHKLISSQSSSISPNQSERSHDRTKRDNRSPSLESRMKLHDTYTGGHGKEIYSSCASAKTYSPPHVWSHQFHTNDFAKAHDSGGSLDDVPTVDTNSVPGNIQENINKILQQHPAALNIDTSKLDLTDYDRENIFQLGKALLALNKNYDADEDDLYKVDVKENPIPHGDQELATQSLPALPPAFEMACQQVELKNVTNVFGDVDMRGHSTMSHHRMESMSGLAMSMRPSAKSDYVGVDGGRSFENQPFGQSVESFSVDVNERRKKGSTLGTQARSSRDASISRSHKGSISPDSKYQEEWSKYSRNERSRSPSGSAEHGQEVTKSQGKSSKKKYLNQPMDDQRDYRKRSPPSRLLGHAYDKPSRNNDRDDKNLLFGSRTFGKEGMQVITALGHEQTSNVRENKVVEERRILKIENANDKPKKNESLYSPSMPSAEVAEVHRTVSVQSAPDVYSGGKWKKVEGFLKSEDSEERASRQTKSESRLQVHLDMPSKDKISSHDHKDIKLVAYQDEEDEHGNSPAKTDQNDSIRSTSRLVNVSRGYEDKDRRNARQRSRSHSTQRSRSGSKDRHRSYHTSRDRCSRSRSKSPDGRGTWLMGRKFDKHDAGQTRGRRRSSPGGPRIVTRAIHIKGHKKFFQSDDSSSSDSSDRSRGRRSSDRRKSYDPNLESRWAREGSDGGEKSERRKSRSRSKSRPIERYRNKHGWKPSVGGYKGYKEKELKAKRESGWNNIVECKMKHFIAESKSTRYYPKKDEKTGKLMTQSGKLYPIKDQKHKSGGAKARSRSPRRRSSSSSSSSSSSDSRSRSRSRSKARSRSKSAKSSRKAYIPSQIKDYIKDYVKSAEKAKPGLSSNKTAHSTPASEVEKEKKGVLNILDVATKPDKSKWEDAVTPKHATQWEDSEGETLGGDKTVKKTEDDIANETLEDLESFLTKLKKSNKVSKSPRDGKSGESVPVPVVPAKVPAKSEEGSVSTEKKGKKGFGPKTKIMFL